MDLILNIIFKKHLNKHLHEKKKLIFLLFIAVNINNFAFAQNVSFQNYFVDGLYKFQDTLKIPKSQVFTQYLQNFGFTGNNTMVLQQSSNMDSLGGVGDRYVQYCNGYPVEGTMMNVISKYGIVLYVNGFSLPSLNVSVSSPISQSIALSAALSYIGAPKYTWQDSTLQSEYQYSLDTNNLDSATYVYDSTKILYPQGQLVITKPYMDTNIHDSAKYALCWKFLISPMYRNTVVVDTSTDTGIVKLDTIVAYMEGESVLVYVNAQTGHIYTADSNRYGSGFWVTCGEHPTWYEGNENVQAYTCTFCFYYTAKDSRNIGTYDNVIGGTEYYNHNNTWGKSTEVSAYWELEKAWDYFYNIHGFAGPTGTRNEQQIIANWSTPILSEETVGRTEYIPGPGTRDNYHLSLDLSLSGWAESAAQLDVIGHEYTHAMIHHASNLDNFGEAGAISEGLCDWFGTYIATTYYPTRYWSDWTNGFGWQTGPHSFSRHWTNPALDNPIAGSGSYGDANWNNGSSGGVSDIYVQSGVMRRFLYTLYTLFPSYEHDDFVTMEWWLWSNMNYENARNQWLAEAEYYYGRCSAPWLAVATAWNDVNVLGVSGPPCRIHRIMGPKVLLKEQLKTSIAQFDILPSGTNLNPHPALYYYWILPQSWKVTYSTDRSSIIVNGAGDYSSQMISCIVVNSDSTLDTLSTFVHFVDSSSQRTSQPQSTIQGTSSGDLQIFPNPVSKQLNVVLPYEPAEDVAFTLLDITGRVVYTSTLSAQVNLVYLPNLSQGIYIVKVYEAGKEYVKRLTVQ